VTSQTTENTEDIVDALLAGSAIRNHGP
jgi:hypothetical protein